MATIPVVNPILLTDLTTIEVDGTGAFDVLMQATKSHLEQEFVKGRIKGTEYATVYLGSVEHVLNAALQFLLQKDKMALDALLVAKQIELAEVEKDKALAELANTQAGLLKIQAEVELIQAQKALADQQLLKIPAEIALLEAQKDHTVQETSNLVTQNTVLIATECKLRAEYDVLMETKLKTAAEKELLAWKTATEKAQTLSTGTDPDSVIGKQKALYTAQTEGFKRDAEQKAAKIMADTWNVRRTTDSGGTEGNTTNLLNDATVGRFINKLATGVGA